MEPKEWFLRSGRVWPLFVVCVTLICTSHISAADPEFATQSDSQKSFDDGSNGLVPVAFSLPRPTTPAVLFDGDDSASESETELTGYRQDVNPLQPQRPLTPYNPYAGGATPDSMFGPQSLRLGSRSINRQILAQRQLKQVPFMIGDSTAGGCGAVSFLPGIGATLTHPTFNCIRLNVAENNSPVPQDRVYFRYNHFHNITEVSVFPGTFDGTSTLDVDRFTFGAEKTFLNGRMSVEARVPFARQLTSDVILQSFQGVDNLPLDDPAVELGNVSFLTKYMLYQSDRGSFSAGLALNTPTAKDVNVRVRVDEDNFEIILPQLPGVVITTINVDADVYGTVDNSTYNLSPFVGAVFLPTDRWFTQGFLQFDVPLNESDTVVQGYVEVEGNRLEIAPDRGKLRQQGLMRLNLGGGYWLIDRPKASFLTGLAGTLEVHYTTTLQDAKIQDVPLPIPVAPGITIPAELTVGNLSNRVDIINLTMGGIFELWNQTTIAHGFVVPLKKTGSDKPFDFEYNLQLNHRF